jgi:hypothetical protein
MLIVQPLVWQPFAASYRMNIMNSHMWTQVSNAWSIIVRKQLFRFGTDFSAE